MPLAQAKTAGQQTGQQTLSANGLILHRDGSGDFHDQYFEPDFWLARGCAEMLGAGRGSNWHIRNTGADWVLRHYRRGGAMARIAADRYAWTGHQRSRSVLEWRLLLTLRQSGLPVPQPVAARVIRRGLSYTADLITEYIPATRTLAELLSDGLTPDVLDAVGSCVRRFHDHGVWHADLNAHNILVDDGGVVYLIDFDRARLRDGCRWRNGNLRRLRRSLDKLSGPTGAGRFDEKRWQTLVSAYDANKYPPRP